MITRLKTSIRNLSLEKIISFLIEALLFSNLWILIYTTILSTLRLIFPEKPNDAFLISGAGVSPEPFEIPLYLLLTFFLIVIIYFLHRNLKKILFPIHPVIKLVFLVILATLFIKNLGPYPLKDEMLFSLNIQAFNPNLVSILYLATLIVVALELLILNQILKKSNYKYIIIYVFVISFITLFTFPPRFHISSVDYSFFYGPIWEITHGKTIYADVTSQYGFLSILVLSFLQKINILSLNYLPVLIWLLLIIQYFLCFYLIHKQSKSVTFGLIGLFSILTINFLTVRIIPTDYPQSGPMRWLPLITSLYLFYRERKITSIWLILFVAFSSLWVIDSGIELVFAYGFTLFLFYLNKYLSFKKLLRSGINLILSIIIIFSCIELIHLFFGYNLINPTTIFIKLREYASAGFCMIPMEEHTYFWVGLFFYLTSIIYFFRKKEGEKESFIIVFSANLMFFASLYYIGRSHPAELYTISIFILLNAFLLLGRFFSNLEQKKAKIIIASILFLIFILFPVINRKEVIAGSIQERLRRIAQGNVLRPELDEVLNKYYDKEKKMIIKYLPDRQIVIISGDDTYLFYLTNKYSLLKDNSLVSIFTKYDLEFSLSKAIKICPKRIAGECRLFKDCAITDLFSKADYASQPIVLNEIQNRCGIKYKPIECTEKLCIAESN